MTDDQIWTAEGGWLRSATRMDSPNFDARPTNVGAHDTDLLVVHHISLPPGFFAGDAIEHFFCNTLDCDAHPYFARLRDVRVSSHFLITRHGGLRQFVNVDHRAWHAGVSSCLGRERCNDFSVGVELQGDGERPFTRAQYQRLDLLLQHLRTGLPLRYVAGHSDIAPGRKFDPGPHFDWPRLMSTAGARGLEHVQAD